MSAYKREFWRYKLFQVPFAFLISCLLALALFSRLNLGLPNVAVTVALDLSGSTHEGQPFNAPGTIMAQSVEAVKAYLQANATLKTPNHFKIIGMGGGKAPELTQEFQADPQAVEAELMKAMRDPKLPQSIQPQPPRDNLNVVFEKATQAFNAVPNMCRELVVISDAGVDLSDSAVSEAVANNIRVSSIVFGSDNVPALQQAATQTKGLYLSGGSADFVQFFTDKFFPKFNSNLRWIIFWIGATWIALMWTLTLPLDIFFQKVMRYPMHFAGKLALGNALFWSAATPGIIWRIAEGLPFIAKC